MYEQNGGKYNYRGESEENLTYVNEESSVKHLIAIKIITCNDNKKVI